MKTVKQNIRDLFDEMVEENKDEIKKEMKDILLATIHNIPSYIGDFIAALGAFEEEDDVNS